MIDVDNFHVLNYVKKEEYIASMDGMRYMLKKKEGQEGALLEAIIWPEPYCFAKTDEKKKQRMEFPLSSQGITEAAKWLNEQFKAQKPVWEAAKRESLW